MIAKANMAATGDGPSPAPNGGGRLPGQGFIRLVGVHDALVAAYKLGNNDCDWDVVEEEPEFFGLDRLRQFQRIK
jgi:hypothetical protein